MRKRNLLAVAAVGVGILIVPLWCAATRLPDLSPAPHSTGGWHLVPPPLPFSLEQVRSYFNDALGKPAYKVSNGTFVSNDRNSSDESVTLVLSAKQQKIALTLFTRGDPGVNYLREFFEAPFFRRSESEQLYVLLEANHDTSVAELGRFEVKIDVFKTPEWLVIALEFSPPAGLAAPS